MKGRYTKITDKNIHLVAYRVNKIAKGRVVDSQWFYDKVKRHSKMFPVYSRPIMRSMIDSFFIHKVELGIGIFRGKFIRISNNERGNDYAATLIRVGDYIKYSKNIITVLVESPNSKELCRKVLKLRD